MNPSVTEFRNVYLDYVLSFLWRQWSVLGVAGYGEIKDNWYIDPEALLLFSLTIARYEPRLFDEIIDWISINGNFINIQRLKKTIKSQKANNLRALYAIADYVSQDYDLLKWKGLLRDVSISNNNENLFFFKDNKPMEQFNNPDETFLKYGLLRGKINLQKHTQPVRIIYNTGLIFKLRSLFGISARCEIILYLLTHDISHPSRIAKEIYYSQKTVQDTLVEMVKSELIYIRPTGKEKLYWLKSEDWLHFLRVEQNKNLRWINWPLFFSALTRIWLKLNQPNLVFLDTIVQASELRILMKEIRTDIESAGFSGSLTEDKFYFGEDYLRVFLQDIKRLLE